MDGKVGNWHFALKDPWWGVVGKCACLVGRCVCGVGLVLMTVVWGLFLERVLATADAIVWLLGVYRRLCDDFGVSIVGNGVWV